MSDNKRMNFIYFLDEFVGRWQNRMSLSNHKGIIGGRMQPSLSDKVVEPKVVPKSQNGSEELINSKENEGRGLDCTVGENYETSGPTEPKSLFIFFTQ